MSDLDIFSLLQMGGRRRACRMRPVLHLGHHRQPQGGALLAQEQRPARADPLTAGLLVSVRAEESVPVGVRVQCNALKLSVSKGSSIKTQELA